MRPADPRDAARAIDAIRRGWPVTIAGTNGTLAALAIETADDGRLAAFDPDGRADVLLSPTRAATLKLANQIAAAVPQVPVRVRRVDWLDLPAAVALADPALDLARPLAGPWIAGPLPETDAAEAALRLARLAGLLPAFFIAPATADPAVTLPADAIAAHDAPATLAIASRARLPVEASEAAEIIAFRGAADAVEHVALVIGSPDGRPPLVRIHSECLTGDALGSLKCDCGPQLRRALAEMAGAGWGILLYLRQEGRGIGLVNKLRAYALQDQGFDTVDANLRLGFAIDARDFAVAARMLELIGQIEVRLMTNNPAKVAGLETAGITVAERVAHKAGLNLHNAGYLDTKRDRTGHIL
ncbi:GTP cyclohydrolase II [Sphingomonas naphthae]|uniref:GTP cyclohydrolase-2 n=1 Tax=Sphingomonas naphthae TaxID=1813468 RepID=A0ABY7TL32_9SPHN|nr:GTP cyclohydrolase II [Sphingomonas naphthae]WCT73422.1 GTP cyclohydrolase II [Sphingomonas naphthae]